jgi:hypothetical protein
MKGLRACILIGAVLLLSSGALASQGVPASAPVGAADGELMKWAVTQGGLTVVVVLLILNELRRSQSLMAALEKATAALAQSTEASRAQAQAFSRMVQSVEQCEAVRQMVRAAEREG